MAYRQNNNASQQQFAYISINNKHLISFILLHSNKRVVLKKEKPSRAGWQLNWLK